MRRGGAGGPRPAPAPRGRGGARGAGASRARPAGRPHRAYELARPKPVDLFFIARRRLLGPLLDAEYGSAAFIAANRPAQYEVRVSASGLLMRPVVSRPAP